MAQNPDGVWGSLSIPAFAVSQDDALAEAQGKITDFIQDFITTINQISELATLGLEVARSALNIAKAFTSALLDPIAALIDSVVDELRELVRSYKDIGLYITGDQQLLRWPWNGVLGGYSEFERRMIARFTDKTDPTRPDIDGTVPTGALFFYVSAGRSEISKLVANVDQFRQMFNFTTEAPGGLPIPTIQGVTYGNDATDVLTFDTMTNLTRFDPTPPNIARVTWKIESSTTRPPSQPYINLPPIGFLVTVSTIREGIPLVFSRPKADSDKKKTVKGGQAQTREYGEVLDTSKNQVVLHGGADQIAFDADLFGYGQLDDTGELKDGTVEVWGSTSIGNNNVIPLGDLLGQTESGDEYLFQRTFLVDSTSAGLQWVREEYSIDLQLNQLPADAKVLMSGGGKVAVTEALGPASTYFVRVATLGDKDFLTDPPEKEWKYDLSSSKIKSAVFTSGQPFVVPFTSPSLSDKTISALSDPFPVTFTNASTPKYLESLQIALVLLVLTRSDLKVVDELEGIKTANELDAARSGKLMLPNVALKATGLESFKALLDLMYDGDWESYASSQESNPVVFRKDLFNRSKRLAQRLYDTTGPMPDVEKEVVQQTETLLTIKWSDIVDAKGHEAAGKQLRVGGDPTILEALNEDVPTDEVGALDLSSTKGSMLLDRGLALSPLNIIASKKTSKDLFEAKKGKSTWVVTDREPHFIVTDLGADLEAAFGEGFQLYKRYDEAEVEEIRKTASSSFWMFFEPYVQDDGSVILPDKTWAYLDELQKNTRRVGSGDNSPVFYTGREEMKGFKRSEQTAQTQNKTMLISFCRTLLAEYDEGLLMREAAVVLGVGGSAGLRSPLDGAWESLRIGDALPQLVETFDSLLGWLDAFGVSLKSAADTLVSYLNFIDGRIVELQQLVRRIDGLLSSSFSAGFNLPILNGLVLSGNGLDGVMADFVNSENKPSAENDSQNYGAGACLLIPGVPAEFFELFQVGADPVGSKTMADPDAVPNVFGIEGIPEEELFPPSDPEPDVL